MSTKDLDDSEVSIVLEDITIDLGYGAAHSDCDNIIYSGGVDTITLDNSTMYSSNTITLPSTTITNGGYTISGAAGSNVYTTGAGSYNWNTATSSTVNISSDGIDMAAGTDIKVDGKSLKEFMNKMEQHLAILVPDPVKLEKFEALKKAYEHYKTMESLCFDEPTEDEED